MTALPVYRWHLASFPAALPPTAEAEVRVILAAAQFAARLDAVA
ncbi:MULTISPECIES: hypothetical protein [Streptomyces violaceusniger group]|uniref:Uncharacterized protein n=1 Tax=Streptomyces antimycoticus TaxID=68175 RepID=A0ABD5JLN8_9ACTN|nr:hypothetical protein [Streptomyces violaceusniger]MEE4588069.1 hypothetical protein [Streptomyces sp. DSM 41602]